MTDLSTQLTSLKTRIDEADRLRVQAEARRELHEQQLADVNRQIEALGVKTAKAEETLVKLEAQLAKEVIEIEAALTDEIQQYRQILGA